MHTVLYSRGGRKGKISFMFSGIDSVKEIPKFLKISLSWLREHLSFQHVAKKKIGNKYETFSDGCKRQVYLVKLSK